MRKQKISKKFGELKLKKPDQAASALQLAVELIKFHYLFSDYAIKLNDVQFRQWMKVGTALGMYSEALRYERQLKNYKRVSKKVVKHTRLR